MARQTTYGGMDVTVQMLHRELQQPLPGSAEPRWDYTVLFTTRAKVVTKAGKSEYAQVVVDGQQASHIFTIRYTTIPFDIRNRLRDVRGTLYKILTISNVDEQNQWFQITAAVAGNEDREAAR